MLSELIKQPLTGCGAKILVVIIRSKILQFSLENEIANLIYTSSRSRKFTSFAMTEVISLKTATHLCV